MWMIVAAMAGSKWADATADVHAETVVSATPEAIQTRLDSTAEWAALLPEDCIRDWVHTDALGPARVTVQIQSFQRRLTARLSIPEAGRRIELDHEGNRGFVTRVLLDDQGDGTTKVSMTTYLNAPGWPFRKYYFERVQPRWVECYDEALKHLAAP